MAKDRENFATEIISDIKRRLIIYRIALAVSIVLNLIQWMTYYEPGNGAPTPEPGGIRGIQTKRENSGVVLAK